MQCVQISDINMIQILSKLLHNRKIFISLLMNDLKFDLKLCSNINSCLCIILFQLCGHIKLRLFLFCNILRICSNVNFILCIRYIILHIFSNYNIPVPWEAVQTRVQALFCINLDYDEDLPTDRWQYKILSKNII